jgi:hypothetical protein
MMLAEAVTRAARRCCSSAAPLPSLALQYKYAARGGRTARAISSASPTPDVVAGMLAHVRQECQVRAQRDCACLSSPVFIDCSELFCSSRTHRTS